MATSHFAFDDDKLLPGVDLTATLQNPLVDAGLATAMVVDSSLPSRDRTVLAVGPGASANIDAITKHLKLFDDVTA